MAIPGLSPPVGIQSISKSGRSHVEVIVSHTNGRIHDLSGILNERNDLVEDP